MNVLKKETRDTYDSAHRGHPAIEELRGIFRYKDLIIQLSRRNLISRYKRSSLGVAWTMLNPLGTMVIMTIVFSQVFGQVDFYPVYVLTGLIAWNFFSQTTHHCMDTILWGSDLYGKIYLPRTAFTISSIATGIINLLLSLVPLFLIMLVTGFPVRLPIIALPLAVLLLAVFSLGFGLLLSAYSVFFPDIAEMYGIVLMAWMYLSPVIVPEEVLATIFNGWVLKGNPLYYFIRLFRDILYDGVFPPLPIWLVAALIALGVLLLGWLVFTKRSDEFAYYL